MIPSDGNATEVTFVQVYSRRPFMGVEHLGESHFQKPISIFCFGQKAAVAIAEDAVAVAGNHFVSPVAKPPGTTRSRAAAMVQCPPICRSTEITASERTETRSPGRPQSSTKYTVSRSRGLRP